MVEVATTRLVELEQTIEQGLSTFMEVGAALLEIKKDKLYQDVYPTFEAYCKHRWDLKRPRAYELMGAAAAVIEMSEISDIAPPAVEAQAAELARVTDPEVRAEVWAEVKAQETSAQPVTAKQVREEVEKRPEAAPKPRARTPAPERTWIQTILDDGTKNAHVLSSDPALVAAELFQITDTIRRDSQIERWEQLATWYTAVVEALHLCQQQEES